MAAAAIRTQSPTHRVGNNHPGCCSSCCFASTQISLSPSIPIGSPVSTRVVCSFAPPPSQWCSSFRLLLGFFFLAPSWRLLRLVVWCSSPRRSKPHIDSPFLVPNRRSGLYTADECGCHPFRWGEKFWAVSFLRLVLEALDLGFEASD
jgi:hypothetical protein